MRRKKLRPIRIKWAMLPTMWGFAEPESWSITVDRRLDDKTLLAIAAHEVAHVVLPVLDESAVNDLGNHIADVLTRMGFSRDGHDETHYRR